MPNQLDKESSLYLRQHRNNPVDWKPWGEDAFREAEERDLPVLVSIGYSSCHWCHVMAHESFEDEYIADLMNRNLVCVKVDREERPDVDQIYMEAVQMITGQGGWPLNVFCLPDGRPFFGGTYFPPEDRGMRILPWPQLIMRIREYFKTHRDELVENGENIFKNIHAMSQGLDPSEWNPAVLVSSANTLLANHDDEEGGFSGAPKFPPSMILSFLLAMRESGTVQSSPAMTNRLDACLEKTCQALARKGLRDHVGGGFFRYCVDGQWTIPHFEKMLYDNALLLGTLSRASKRYASGILGQAAHATVDWLYREMGSPSTGFASAIDADSPGGEGAFYTWNPEEILQVLGKEKGERLCRLFSVTQAGNFENQRTHLQLPVEGDPAIDSEDLAALLEARNQRARPDTDEKRLLGWNSLLAGGLAEAGLYLGQTKLAEDASTLLDFLFQTFQCSDGSFRTVAYHGKATETPAFLNDLAWLAEACLRVAATCDLHHPVGSEKWIERAEDLVGQIEGTFGDPSSPGCFFSAHEHGERLPRKKEWYDNATPSGNASLLHVYAKLFFLTGKQRYQKAYAGLRALFGSYATKVPNGIAHALAAMSEEAIGYAMIRARTPEDLREIQERFSRTPVARPVFFRLDESLGGRYEICVATQCLPVTADPNEILLKLGA